MSIGIRNGVGIYNNTNMGIPPDLIKTAYFTDVKNTDGSLLSMLNTNIYDEFKNYIYFNACDKAQNVQTHLEVVLINDVILRTTNVREVIVK